MSIPKLVLSCLSSKGIKAFTKMTGESETLAFEMGGKKFAQVYNKAGKLTDYRIAGPDGYKQATISRFGDYTSCLFEGEIYPRGNYLSPNRTWNESCIQFHGSAGVMKESSGTFESFSVQRAEVIGTGNYTPAYEDIAKSMYRDITMG